jgi:hypothetical protein
MSAPRQHRGGAARRIAAALCSFLLLLAVFAQASPARSPAGCTGKPGSPDRGALKQYCPSEVKKKAAPAAPAAPSTGTGSGSSGTAEASGPSDGDSSASPKTSGPKIPLTDYPSSGGVNALLFALLVAIAVAVAYGARRWRRGSAAAP